MQKIAFSITILLSSIFYSPSTAQTDKIQEYSVPQLKEDFNVLKNNLEVIHAGLYRYTTKTKLDSLFNSIEHQLDEPMTSIEFYRSVKPILKHIANGHTEINPSKDYLTSIIKELPRFPFVIDKVEEGLKILSNKSRNTVIQNGDIIVSINNKIANNVFNLLVDNTTRDGYSLSLPRIKVATNFSGSYAVHIGTPKKFKLSILRNKELIDVEVDALTPDEISQVMEQRDIDSFYYAFQDTRNPIQFWIEDNTGFLVLKTFNKKTLNSRKVNFKKEYKSHFKKLRKKKIERLVIDLRNNQGGHLLPHLEFLRYLIDEPFTACKIGYLKTNILPTEEYVEKNNSYNEFHQLILTPATDGTFERTKWAGLIQQKPQKYFFSGKLIILINEFTFSAAADVAGHLKDKTNATFIGSETGGNPNECTSGISITIELPNTKNILRIPTTAWVNNINFSSEGFGIIPDLEYKTNWAHQEIRPHLITQDLKNIIKNIE